MGKPISAQLLEEALADQFGRPLHDLRISVIDRCNFRCPYCMPEARYPRDHAFLKAAERLDFAEIVRAARVFASLGVVKLRLTGGEPLLRKGIAELVASLKALPGVEVAMTTNASLLSAHAAALRAAGLDRLTISLDSLDAQRFAQMSGGRGALSDVLEGIAAAQTAGFSALKFNCVVQRGVNEEDVLPLVEHFRGTGHVLRFIEFMDVGTCNGWRAESVVSARQLRERVHARFPLSEVAAGYQGEVAQRYQYLDGAGEVGFIASVSQPFCGDCSRARLSADGQLYTCLFGAKSHDLRALLRAGASDGELAANVRGIWQRRTDRYSQTRAETQAARPNRVEMYQIGG